MKLCLLCFKPVRSVTWSAFFGQPPDPLCSDCLGLFQPIAGPICPGCGRSQKGAVSCEECRSRPNSPLLSNRSLFFYNEAMQTYMAQFKYRGDYALAGAFQRPIRRAARQLSCDIICPVPITPSRLAERRFNQSEALLKEAGLPFQRLLGREEADKQSKKSMQDRLAAPQTFFVTKRVEGKTVLVVDDIYTTGATMRLVAAALAEAGAVCVKSLTLARSTS